MSQRPSSDPRLWSVRSVVLEGPVHNVTPELNPEIVGILDMSLRLALWTFWGIFSIAALYAVLTWAFSSGRYNVLRPCWHGFLLASMIGGFSFFVYALAPFPLLHNFSTSESWKKVPLRLTALSFDRFQDGFSLTGEVWNQQDEPLPDIQVIVTIRDHNKELLEEVTLATEPPLLEPGQTAQFELDYRRNSTLLYGYEVRFQTAQGEPIQHIAGFNVE